MSVLDVYKQLHTNKPIVFDLTDDLTEFVCKNNKDHTASHVSHFTRTCKYIRDHIDLHELANILDTISIKSL